MATKFKRHFPWLLFVFVLGISLGILETQSLDHHARHQSELSEIKTAWVQKQTQVMSRGELGNLSQIQQILDITRGPGSVKALD
jgi:hypothetical protein